MLEKINYPKDIKNLGKNEMEVLAKEIREFLVDSISKTGGHLASNLGVVELTIALMKSFDFPRDSIVWDVGHQSYVYKILTGRREQLSSIRELDSIAGFPNREESEYDIFGTGHASTSIAAANGIATAKRLKGDKSFTIAVIGDGALTGGLALESINNLISSNNRILVILNDNEMSIDENVGLASKLSKLRLSDKYINFKDNISNTLDNMSKVGNTIYKTMKKTKDSIKKLLLSNVTLENIGIKYYGIVDGHNTEQLINIFNNIKNLNRPVVLHIKTQKGRGYEPAIKNPSKFHGVSSFDAKSGKILSTSQKSFTEIFSEAIVDLSNSHKDVVAITAAMLSSTGLSDMKKLYPKRVIDVGIAESYAVTYAAGLATQNIRPVVCIYSTFLQRAYDQLLHDVCLQKLPVIFAIDRAGIVGKDGATHQGLFDISYLNTLPNMNIFTPMNAYDLRNILEYVYELNEPVAIRYPRGNAIYDFEDKRNEISKEVYTELKNGENICILAVGTMVVEAMKAAELLLADGINVGVIAVRRVKPICNTFIDDIARRYKCIFTVEEGIISGGFGNNILRYITEKYDNKVYNIGIEDKFIEHGEVGALKRRYALDAKGIYTNIKGRQADFEREIR